MKKIIALTLAVLFYLSILPPAGAVDLDLRVKTIAVGDNTVNEYGIGYRSLYENSGIRSNGFGYESLGKNSGTNSNGFGYLAGYGNSGAHGNFFGNRAGYRNAGGYSNAFGHAALANVGTEILGNGNNAFGYEALLNNGGEYNNGFGMRALSTSLYSYNSAFGNHALTNSRSSYNTAIGVQAISNNVAGSEYSSGFGYWAMNMNAGWGSQGFGAFSLFGNTGKNNNAIGYGTVPISLIRGASLPTPWTATGSGNGSINSYPDFIYPGSAITRNTRIYRISAVVNNRVLELSRWDALISTGKNVARIDHTNVPVYVGPYPCSSRSIWKWNIANGKWYLVGVIYNNVDTRFTDKQADDDWTGKEFNGPKNMLMIGNFAQSLTDNDAVFGDSKAPLSRFYFGGIYYNSSDAKTDAPLDGDGSSAELHAMGGRGTDKSGGNLELYSGSGTGTVDSGEILFKVAPGGGSSSLANAFRTAIRIKGTGVINIPTISSYNNNAAALGDGLVEGDLYVTPAGALMRVYTP